MVVQPVYARFKTTPEWKFKVFDVLEETSLPCWAIFRNDEVVQKLLDIDILLAQYVFQISTELRDALLPKLISGEIRVPEAEAAVGAAL